MQRVLIIGAGQIGSRHLQGLLGMETEVEIGVVDPSAGSLSVARERADQAGVPGNVKALHFADSLAGIPFSDADLAIIATNADVRGAVIEELAGRIPVRNMILEKVVFQSESQFEKAGALLDAKGTAAWVNTPRRVYPFYSRLRESVKNEPRVDVTVSGSGWGLACNMVHYIDLFAFLTGSENIGTDYAVLDQVLAESKRPGFYEANGRIGFSSGSGALHLSCTTGGSPGTVIHISSGEYEWIISEAAGTVVTMKGRSPMRDAVTGVQFPYQSQLTGKLAGEISAHGNCGLTPFRESQRQHLLFLPLLTRHFSKLLGEELENCPIT